jgi:inhibitor of KinA
MHEEGFSILPLGDAAVIIDFGNRIDSTIHDRVSDITRALQEASIFGVRDIVPAYSSITIHYDLIKVARRNPGTTAFSNITQTVEGLLRARHKTTFSRPLRTRIPVCYALQFAPDLIDVAAYAGLSVPGVVGLHTSTVYRIYMIGFLPGFAYLGEVDERIAMPRKARPRMQIAAGSVGIAGKQTGIYPLTSPGGWQIIGRTPVSLFDKNKPDPVLLKAGDEVVFFSITEDEFNSY